MDNIKAGLYDLETYIMTEEYYLTNLDIWILSVSLNLPIVLISSTRLNENKETLLRLVENAEEYIFVKVPATVRNQIRSYRLIKGESYRIKVSELSDTLNRDIENNYMMLDDYISNFKSRKKILKLKVKDKSA